MSVNCEYGGAHPAEYTVTFSRDLSRKHVCGVHLGEVACALIQAYGRVFIRKVDE